MISVVLAFMLVSACVALFAYIYIYILEPMPAQVGNLPVPSELASAFVSALAQALVVALAFALALLLASLLVLMSVDVMMAKAFLEYGAYRACVTREGLTCGAMLDTIAEMRCNIPCARRGRGVPEPLSHEH